MHKDQYFRALLISCFQANKQGTNWHEVTTFDTFESRKVNR